MAAKSTKLIFKLKVAGDRKVRTTVRHTDTKAYEVAVQAAGKNDTLSHPFQNGDDGGTGLVFHTKGFGEDGDVHVQFWEVDKWKKPSTKSYRIFRNWHTVGETDTTDEKNDLLGSLQGYVRAIRRKRRRGLSYEFVCTADPSWPEPKSGDDFITIQYAKRDAKKPLTRKLKILGEREHFFEFATHPTTDASEKKFETAEYPAAPLFVESMRNLVRTQLEEGGLTVAFHADLNTDHDDVTAPKHAYSVKALLAQLASGRDQARQVLAAARAKAKAYHAGKKSPAPSEAERWARVEVEFEWIYQYAKLILHAGRVQKGNPYKVKAGRALLFSGKESLKDDLKKPATFPAPAKVTDFFRNNGYPLGKRSTVTATRKGSRWTVEDPDARKKFRLSRRGRTYSVSIVVSDRIKGRWDAAGVHYARRVAAGKAGKMPSLKIGKTRHLACSFSKWKQTVTAMITAQKGKGKSGDVWPHLLEHYGIPKGDEAKAFGAATGTANICQDLDWASIEAEEPAATKAEPGTTKKIKDIYNDMEFPRNAQLLAGELGFLNVNSSGELIKGAQTAYSPDEIVPHLKKVCSAVEAAYPDLVGKGKKAKIFRFIYFSHGWRSGIKFRSDDGKSFWMETKNYLNKPAGDQFIGKLAGVLAPKAVVTFFACSTGGSLKLGSYRRERQKAAKARINQELQVELAGIAAGEKTARQKRKLSRAARRKARRAVYGEQRRIRNKFKKVKASTHLSRLVKYGGNPALTTHPRNLLGAGSFAEAFREKLKAKGVKADIWSHVDAGHASRNSRMRLFAHDGQVHDFIRLVFAEDAEFKKESAPTKKHLAWWWGRGQSASVPMEQWHAFKRAGLCSSDTISTEQGYFSLKKVIDDLRGWYA